MKNIKKLVKTLKKLGEQLFGNESIHYIQIVEEINKTSVFISLFSNFIYSIVVSNKSYNLNNAVCIMNAKNGEMNMC